jgi:hypothetical protein
MQQQQQQQLVEARMEEKKYVAITAIVYLNGRQM